MPRFFFDVFKDDGISRDKIGMEAKNLAEAAREAAHRGRALLDSAGSERRARMNWMMVARDDTGIVVFAFRLAAAISPAPPTTARVQ